MTMNATVIEVYDSGLLVSDLSTSQEVLVNKQDICRVWPQDLVRIEFSEAIVKSIPPQITADSITLVSACSCGHVHSC